MGENLEISIRDRYIARAVFCYLKLRDKRGCLRPVDDQADRHICYAYALRDALYADEFLNGRSLEPHLISLQDVMQFLHLKQEPPAGTNYDPEKIDWGFGVSNTFHHALLYTQSQGVLLEEDYPFMGSMEPDLKFEDRIEGTLVTIKGGWYIRDTEHEACRAELKECPLVGTLAVTHKLSNWNDKDRVYVVPREKKGVKRLKMEEEPMEYHSVLIVGYGRQNGKNYYVVKSSWGVGWGYNGYAKIDEKAFEGYGDFARPVGTEVVDRIPAVQ